MKFGITTERSAPTAPDVRTQPLDLDELRHKARTNPAIQEAVSALVLGLRERPDLATDEQRSKAFDDAQRAMAEAAAQGLKPEERNLRLQLLALDVLRRTAAQERTETKFRSFFKRVDANLDVSADMRSGGSALHQARESQSDEDREFVRVVDARADRLRRDLGDANVDELHHHWRALKGEVSPNDEASLAKLSVDKSAFAIVHREAVDRECALATQIGNSRLKEVLSLSASEQQDLRHDAVLLLSRVDEEKDWSPYENDEFVRSELIDRADDAHYARVVAIVREAAYPHHTIVGNIAKDDERLRANADARIDALVTQDRLATDRMLDLEIAEGRVNLAFAKLAGDDAAVAAATERLAVLFYVNDTLPFRRDA